MTGIFSVTGIILCFLGMYGYFSETRKERHKVIIDYAKLSYLESRDNHNFTIGFLTVIAGVIIESRDLILEQIAKLHP